MLLKKALGYHFTIKFTLHMWVDQKKKKKSQRKKRNLLLVYLQEDSFLASFSSTNGIKKKKAGRKPMIYLKGPGVFCPVA